jgi:hypothetical protein
MAGTVAPRRVAWVFVAVFVLRFGFGVMNAGWPNEDERQTYLIGLKAYTTRTWPYFGPDLNGSESDYRSQLPGALEALMIAAPLYFLPLPEAPFLFQNLLSTTAVVLLAAYISRRLPLLSFGWLALWIAVAPWSLHLATRVYNPGYLMLPATLVFVGVLDTLPATRVGVLRTRTANVAMGAGIVSAMQFHYSFLYLLPFAAWALAAQVRERRAVLATAEIVAGALVPFAFVLPTFLVYGWAAANPGSGFAVPFNAANVAALPVIVARVLSMATFELPRFLGNNTDARLAFLTTHWPLFVPGVLLAVVGAVQPLVLLAAFFRRIPAPGWTTVRALTAMAVALACISFWFTVKRPLSHIFFIFFPLLMVYSCYCWAAFAADRRWRTFARAFLVVAALFQVGYAIAVAPASSLYTNREPAQRAIHERDYRILGERRIDSLY